MIERLQKKNALTPAHQLRLHAKRCGLECKFTQTVQLLSVSGEGHALVAAWSDPEARIYQGKNGTSLIIYMKSYI
jgi:hypothetical protein